MNPVPSPRRPWRLALASAAALVLGLGGCEAVAPPGASAAVVTPAVESWAPTPPPAEPEAGPAVVPAPEPRLGARPPPPPNLLGMSRDDIAELLGPPGFRRRDAPAEVWQYRSRDCTLDLFLYREDGAESYRVAYVEARGRNAARLSTGECVSRLLERAGKGRSG